MADQDQLGLLAPMSNAEHALLVLAGQANAPWPLTEECRKVLGLLIYHKGAASAIQIKEISAYTKLSDRVVKDAVRSLIVDFKVRIGASRGKVAGYYLVMTAEEAEQSARALVHEIRELARRVRVLTDGVFISEQNGQMRIEIPKEVA
jgi:hypothetical protein